MDPEAVRAFVGRDWARVDALKRAYHADRARGAEPHAGFVLSQALREHARRVRPDWPTPRDRTEDLNHHVDLKRKLERAAHAFPEQLIQRSRG